MISIMCIVSNLKILCVKNSAFVDSFFFSEQTYRDYITDWIGFELSDRIIRILCFSYPLENKNKTRSAFSFIKCF